MKKIISVLTAFFTAAFAFSQATVNPNDAFYDYSQEWELRGIIQKNLPQLRPYPSSVVKEILQEVIENGSDDEVELAKSEYERNFGRVWHVSFEGTAMVKKESELQKFLVFEPSVYGDLTLTKLASLGYSVGFYGANNSDYKAYIPYAQNILHDSIYDPATLGPFKTYSDWNTILSFGKENVYVTGGVNRIGFGSFHREGLTLNDGAYHSANITFNYTGQKVSYTQALESLGATNNFGGDLSDNKFLVFHSLKLNLTSWLNVSYYENILFGPGFDLTYMLPAPMMAIQNIGGANSNLQMGLVFDVKPFKGFLWSTDFFVDDYSVNDFVKLNFDAKYRFAFQSGIVYTPENSFLTKISTNYTCVMPYVYSHWEYENESEKTIFGTTYNYQNYTNNGINIGSALEPNSDGVNLNVSFRPSRRLNLNLKGAFIRHANSAEDFSDEDAAGYVLAEDGKYSTDGTAFMQQMFDGGKHVTQAWDKLGFMTSDHKKLVGQAGVEAEFCAARTKYGTLTFKAGYTFEYIKNANIDRNVFNGGKISWTEESSSDGKYKIYKIGDETFDGGSTEKSFEKMKQSETVRNEIKRQRDEWISGLVDKKNHYISFSVKYSY